MGNYFKDKSIFKTNFIMGSITDRCRALRNNPTKAERVLWQALRMRNLKERKFFRQFPLHIHSINGRKGYFIADFYCKQAKLVVEVDGAYHLEHKTEDENRDLVISTYGLKTLRFTNEQVLTQLDMVIDKIKEAL